MAQVILNYSFPLPPGQQKSPRSGNSTHLRSQPEEFIYDDVALDRHADNKRSPYFQDGSQQGMFWYAQQPSPPAIPRYERGHCLQSKIERFRAIWFITVLTCIVTIFSIYYSYRALVSESVVPRNLALSPGKTVLVVNILSHVVALLCLHAFSTATEALRWSMACRVEKGILFTTFLALSRATPLTGVWFLIFKRGSHQIWCCIRLLAVVLYHTVGLVLIADITFKTIYNAPENSTPISVLAGTAPFNAAYVSLVPSETLNVFSASYTMGFLTDPRYVINIPPINCQGVACNSVTSIFLPGSLALVRLDNGQRNATLFSSSEFLAGDSVLIHDAPGFQVEFDSVDSNFRFNATSDCEMYMDSLGDGLYICISTSGPQMNVGWTICPNTIVEAGENCAKASANWTQTMDQVTSVSMFKRYATTAYDFKNMSIISIESVGPPEIAPIQSSDFKLFLDLVLGAAVPKVLNFSDPNAFRVGATRYSVQYSLGWLLRLYKTDFNTYNDGGLSLLQGLIAVPLQFSTSIWQQKAYSTLPADMKVTATITTSSYRAMIPPWTLWVFGLLAALLLLWGIICLGWVFLLGPNSPNASQFPELDITSKCTVPTSLTEVCDYRGGKSPEFLQDLGRHMRTSGLGNGKTVSVARSIRNRRMYCGSRIDPKNGEQIVVIVTQRGVVGELIEHEKYV